MTMKIQSLQALRHAMFGRPAHTASVTFYNGDDHLTMRATIRSRRDARRWNAMVSGLRQRLQAEDDLTRIEVGR